MRYNQPELFLVGVETMRRIDLKGKTEVKYETIKELVDHGGNKDRAALALDCTRRTIDRYIAGYKAGGKAFFVHGNTGWQPAHTLDDGIRRDIVDFYNGKYRDANFAHFAELLSARERITVSESLVRNVLRDAGILSPKARRKTRREHKKRLKAALGSAKSTDEKKLIEAKLVDAEEAHPRRPRCSRFGEMVQMDASLHPWFGDVKATLHIAIDDATGMVVGAWFGEQETLRGYYSVLKQILDRYGIPFMFYTDRRTVFEYRRSGSKDVANDTLTQFGYACKQLGVQIETTSVAQAKGRVERLIQTMQSRLPVELRLGGVATLEQANEFLAGFIARYNAKFALPYHSIPSVFETQPSEEKTDMILAVIAERTVDSGHSIHFENKYLRTLNRHGRAEYLQKGTAGLVIRTFSGGLFFTAGDRIYALEEIPAHERTSKNFDFRPAAPAPKKPYIPPLTHPWRRSSFKSFARGRAGLSA